MNQRLRYRCRRFSDRLFASLEFIFPMAPKIAMLRNPPHDCDWSLPILPGIRRAAIPSCSSSLNSSRIAWSLPTISCSLHLSLLLIRSREHTRSLLKCQAPHGSREVRLSTHGHARELSATAKFCDLCAKILRDKHLYQLIPSGTTAVSSIGACPHQTYENYFDPSSNSNLCVGI